MATTSLNKTISVSYLAGTAETHGCIGFERPTELHWGAAFLDNLGILTVQTPLLVLLHSSNLFFQSTGFSRHFDS